MNKCFRLVGLLSFLKNKWNNSKHNKTSLSSRTIKFPYPITLRLIVFLVLSFISSYIFLKHHKVFYKQTSSSSSLHKQVQQIHLLLHKHLSFQNMEFSTHAWYFELSTLRWMPVDISGFHSSHKYIILIIAAPCLFFAIVSSPSTTTFTDVLSAFVFKTGSSIETRTGVTSWGKNGTVEWTWNNKTSIKKKTLCTQANKKSKVYGHFAIKPCSGASPFDAQI